MNVRAILDGALALLGVGARDHDASPRRRIGRRPSLPWCIDAKHTGRRQWPLQLAWVRAPATPSSISRCIDQRGESLRRGRDRLRYAAHAGHRLCGPRRVDHGRLGGLDRSRGLARPAIVLRDAGDARRAAIRRRRMLARLEDRRRRGASQPGRRGANSDA